MTHTRVSPSPAAWFAGATAAYLCATFFVAWSTRTGFASVDINPAGSTWLAPAFGAVLILGVALAYILPGMAFADSGKGGLDYLIRAFLLSILLHTAVLSTIKLAGVELTRTSFVVSCMVLCGVAWWRRRPPVRIDGETARDLLTTLVLGATVTLVFFTKIFVEDLGGDGSEHFEFTRSLTTHLLPYWDLENGYWGFHHRFMFFAYPSLLSMLSVGEIELSVRVVGVVFLCFACMLTLQFVPAGSSSRWWTRVVVFLSLFLLYFFNAYYSTWEPWIADVAEPLATDLITTCLVMASVYFLEARNRSWFLTCALLASVCTQFGAALVALTLGVFAVLTRARRVVLESAVLFAVGYAVIVGLSSAYAMYEPRGETIFGASNLSRYWSAIPDIRGVAIQLFFLVLMTGGASIAGIPAIRVRDPLSMRLYAAALAYAFLLSLSSRINPHYFIPPAVMLLSACVRRLSMVADPRRWGALTMATTLGALWLVIPTKYETFKNPSRLGARVELEASDYQSQVAMAHLLDDVFPYYEYGVGAHQLVIYSKRHACRDCEYVVSRNAAERSGYEIVKRDNDLVLFRKRGSAPRAEGYNRASYCPSFLKVPYSAYRRRVEHTLQGPATLPWAICLQR